MIRLYTLVPNNLLGGGVFGDGLGAFRDGVLGQFTRKQEANGSLDFTAADRRLLVVRSQLGRLGGNAFEDVVDERVHDRHGLVGDADIRVDLLQDLVDVRRVRLLAGLLLLGSDVSLWLLAGWLLGRGLLGGGFLWWHCWSRVEIWAGADGCFYTRRRQAISHVRPRPIGQVSGHPPPSICLTTGPPVRFRPSSGARIKAGSRLDKFNSTLFQQ